MLFLLFLRKSAIFEKFFTGQIHCKKCVSCKSDMLFYFRIQSIIVLDNDIVEWNMFARFLKNHGSFNVEAK